MESSFWDLLKSWFDEDRRPTHSRLGVERCEDRTVPSAVLDLTARGSMGTLEEALFRQSDLQPTGTGHINSFLRVQGAAAKGPVQQGYNTDARPLQFDENKSPQFTRSLRLDDVPLVNLGGRQYREFVLDINQKSSQPLLSLDELRVFVAPSGSLTGYDATTHKLAGRDAVYDMDAGGDNWVKLDYRLNSGSGSGDMLLDVPESAFAGGGTFVYFYSKFGVEFSGNAGFQEWAAGRKSAIGSISGTKFNDLNGDGIRDAGELGLADWVIYLDANNNGALDSGETYTITDANGNYRFDGLSAGLGALSTYYVREVQQDGWTQTTTNPEPIVLTFDGQEISGILFGNNNGGGGGRPT